MDLSPITFSALIERLEHREYVSNWGAALVASTIANVNRGKGDPAFEVDDFMPKRVGRKEESKTQSSEEMAAIALDIALAAKGNVVRGGMRDG